MIVRTFDGFKALTTPAPTWSGSHGSSLHLYDRAQSYGETYARDPNMRIPIDFLMRNVAHLAPPQVFRRVSDTDRVRLTDHPLARWLKHPNPATTGYRLFETLMGDLGVYMEAFWLKVRYDDAAGQPQIGLVALPPQEMTVQGHLLPSQFCWTVNGRPRDFAPSELVYFNGYNPIDRLRGLSLFETLRSIVSEDAAAADHRESFWRNAARIGGVVTRPSTVRRYTKEQAADWREQYQATYAGATGEKTLLLQEGETFTPGSWSAKESEYVAGLKARREVSAAGWHAPQPFVGILDHATFSNIREQHKNLYQDVLGPTFEMVTQELERQLLPECDDTINVYLEFNISAKLAGTPEERAQSMQISIGRPWRTVNEGRALDNLPRIDDPELDTVAPQQGGPSDATAHPTDKPAPMMTRPDDPTAADARTVAVLQAHRTRQLARLNKLPLAARASAFFADITRWNRELADDLIPIVGALEAERQAVEANATTFMALDALEEAA